MEWKLTVSRPTDEAPLRDTAALSERDDAELVRLARAGEAAAFDVLVKRHQRAVYRLCHRFVRHHEDASDLAQESFVKAWRGLSRFKGDAQFSTWVYRIAANACLNRVTTRRLPAAPIDQVEHVEDAHAERPGASLQRAERARAVRRAIHALPRTQRATLVLRMYHDLTHQQVADILGSSVGAVKANFFHALANLRRILGAEP